MRKATWFILNGGLFVAVAAYACVYWIGTARQRSLDQADQPALVWLKQEYQLDDAQFVRLRALHEAYRPQCRAMCRRIDVKNAQIEQLLAATNRVTPAIRQALAEAARIRAECEAAMLEHFYRVAQAMPPEQGKRYLAWVEQQTLKPRQMMPGEWAPSSARGMR